jgi:hypothetical protein
MKTKVTATVVNGMLELDERIQLPDNSRVSVTVEAVEQPSVEPSADQRHKTGWEAFKQRIRERPVHSGGLHYTREELHERR